MDLGTSLYFFGNNLALSLTRPTGRDNGSLSITVLRHSSRTVEEIKTRAPGGDFLFERALSIKKIKLKKSGYHSCKMDWPETVLLGSTAARMYYNYK